MADNWLKAFSKDFWKRPQPVNGKKAYEAPLKKARFAPGDVTEALTNPSQRRAKR